MSEEPPRALSAPLASGAARCAGTSRSTGEQCRLPAEDGTPWCKFHGAHANRGLASPTYKHGKYSAFLPSRMVEHYEAALNDDDLLSLTNELALTDTILADYIRRLETGESGALWKAAQKTMRELIRARDSHLPDSASIMGACLLELEQIILRGAREEAVRSEIQGWVETRRKVSESERKRLEAADVLIDVREAQAMLHAVALVVKESVERWVDDKASQRAIFTDVSNAVARFARGTRQWRAPAEDDGERGVQGDL